MTATVVCERHKSHVTVEMDMFELFIVLPSDAELTDLKGREKITEKLFSLIEFSGE